MNFPFFPVLLKWGASYHAGWCPAPVKHGTAPPPDADFRPLRCEAASQWDGSQERSACTPRRAPPSAAGWSSCPLPGWSHSRSTDEQPVKAMPTSLLLTLRCAPPPSSWSTYCSYSRCPLMKIFTSVLKGNVPSSLRKRYSSLASLKTCLWSQTRKIQ